MGIPDEDRVPYRHSYGNYTHLSGNLQYRFEWTPFTPAIVAWQRAESSLKSALDHLVEAQKLDGLGLNGLASEHERLIGSLKVLADDTHESHVEAGKVVDALQVANTDYAASAESSLAEYQALMKAIDGTTSRQRGDHTTWDNAERASESQRDKDIYPYEGDPPK
jgi:hypothetical protein